MKQAIVGIALAAALLVGVLAFSSNEKEPTLASSSKTTREVALTCGPEMAQGFHIHPILEILVNGEKVEVPANIGVGPTCMTALHTHTPDGLIHVESPEKRDFTLGDFFAVWEQPFNKNQILGNQSDATHHIRVTVDGVEVDTYENTILRDRERIVIRYESHQ